jgi:endonuclease I
MTFFCLFHKKFVHRIILICVQVLFILVFSRPAGADIPPGYYDSVDTSNASALRATLHAVIDDHTRYPYTSYQADTWDILELADEDPNNSSNILDVYKNASYPKQGGGNSYYSREHTWPSSYGFPSDWSGNYPYTDCHQLHLCDYSYNSSRSNKPFRTGDASTTEKPTLYNNGKGGGAGVYPGNSNWTWGSYAAGGWEVWNGRRGDVARSLFYLDMRYEGGTHGVTGYWEPDLILTDDQGLIEASNTGYNESVAYMGMLTVLLQWHAEDPVDDDERYRNDMVYSFQGNRNPFVDHPEWIYTLFGIGPELENPGVSPDFGYYGTRFEYTVHYYHPGGDPPALIQVYIDDIPYDMTLDSGTAADGTYRYRTRNISQDVSHEYYFYAEDSVGESDRAPGSGTQSGPVTYDPELFLTGTPGPGAWMTVEVWGAKDALWGVAWSRFNGPFYLPASGLTYDVGPGNLHLAKKVGEAPLHLDVYGFGMKDFQLPAQVSSGTKYIQGTTKMNAYWAKTNVDTFVVP